MSRFVVLALIAVVLCCANVQQVNSQACSRLLQRCGEGCCALNVLALRGTCTIGSEGQGCGGVNMCKCNEEFECRNRECVRPPTTTSIPSPPETTPVPAETTTPQVEQTSLPTTDFTESM